jgi:hypothetical protein
MMIEELYDALREAGVSEEKARGASKAVADFRESIHGIQLEVLRLRTDLTAEMHEIRSTVRLLTWMTGTVLAAIVLPMIVKLFNK